MSKVRPNDPCACGSGKKVKKCCGIRAHDGSSSAVMESPHLDGTWGLAGIPLLLNVTPFNSKGLARPNPVGKPGKYKASFLLGKPSQPALDEHEVIFEFDQTKGSSHLFLGDPNEVYVKISANLPEGDYDFTGYANAKGYLSKIEIDEFDALSIQDAMDKAFNALYPVLSRLSILNNVPVAVHRFAIVEVATNNHLSSITLPFVNQPAPTFENVQKDSKFDRFASLYREGLNSNSPNYQFLCFYKIIEGIRAIREERTRKDNQKILLTGKKPVRLKEVLPAAPSDQQEWLSALYGRQKWSDLAISQVFSNGVAGRKINDLIASSKELDTVRNKIAHTILRDESKEPITIDNGMHIREVDAWLPLCKSLALFLLKKEYSF